jgi:ribonuclease P protein component
LIWSIRDRGTFAAFRTDAVRVRQGPVGIAYLAPAPDAGPVTPPRVAFAIGRRVGHAVERNLVRRRLRAIVAAADPKILPAGSYLVTAAPDAVDLSYQELREHVERALRRLQVKVSDPARSRALDGPVAS